MFCSRCGSRNDDGTKACGLCGLELGGGGASTSSAPAPPAPAVAIPAVAPSVGPASAGPAKPTPNSKRPIMATMMGVAFPPSDTPPASASPTSVGAPASAAAPSAHAPASNNAAVKPQRMGTMLGVAFPPGQAPPGVAPPAVPGLYPPGMNPAAVPAQPAKPKAHSDLFTRSPRRVLADLFQSQGEALFANPQNTNALLYGDYANHVNLLMMALTDNVPQMLLNASGETPPEMLIRGFTRRMMEARHLSEEQARYAVETWAVAIGMLDGLAVERLVPPAHKIL